MTYGLKAFVLGTVLVGILAASCGGSSPVQIQSKPTDDPVAGTYLISGDLSGEVTLALTMSGAIQDDGNGDVIRVPGSTTISGTATSGDGRYTVAITR